MRYKPIKMKKILFFVCLCISIKLPAQFSIKVFAAMAKPSKSVTSKGFPGAGAEVSYNQKKMEIGLDIAVYPKNDSKEERTSLTLNYTNSLFSSQAFINYKLLNQGSKFYIFTGLSTGLNSTKQVLAFQDGSRGSFRYSETRISAIVAPKIGIAYQAGKRTGVFAKVLYNLPLNKREPTLIGFTAVGESIEISAVQEYISAALGLSIKL